MKINYKTYSKLAKHDTLFIHGNLASARWWSPMAEEWQRAGSLGPGRLLLADLRGCGQNEDWPIDKPFTLQELAQDALDLLDDANVETVDLVGHSLGGLVALQMMLMAPERVRKAYLLCPVGAKGVVFDEGMFDIFRQMAANPEITRAVILSTISNHQTLPEPLKDEISEDAFKAVKGIGFSVLKVLEAVDIRRELAKLNKPVKIVHGKEDLVIKPEDSINLKSLITNADLEILDNVGHSWNVENPKAFTNHLRQWL